MGYNIDEEIRIGEAPIMPELLNAIVIVSFVGIILLMIYLTAVLVKRHRLHGLYAESARDFRFVCELLRLFVDKDSIIKNPCLLRNYGSVPPRADALIVGGGGLLIITAIDEPGQYSTPLAGDWTVWQNGEMKRLENGFRAGRQYITVLTNVMVKNGLSCPVVNLVVLTDDHAQLDSLHEEYVLTGDLLVPYVKEFLSRRALGRSGQQKLKKAIRQHHEYCQRQLSTAMASDAEPSFSNTGEFGRIDAQKAEKAAPEPQNDSEESGSDDVFEALLGSWKASERSDAEEKQDAQP